MKKIFYIIYALLLLISIVIFNNNLLYCIFWNVMCIFLIIKNRIPKDNNYLKKTTINIIIISIMFYFLIVYSLGLFTGFYKNILDNSFLSIIKNSFIPLSVIVSQEIIRYIYAKNFSYNISVYILLCIIMIVIDIVMEINFQVFISVQSIFIFITTVVVPKVVINMLYSYITYKISFIPTLIHKIVFNIYIFILPIFPNLGNYLNAVISIIYPYLIYRQINKVSMYYDKSKNSIIRKNSIVYILIIPFLLIIVLLTSGIFKYQLIAIGSGSMEPVIYRGDAVLIKKNININDVRIGTVIAYKKNNLLITHRVVGMDKKNNQKIFKTKGDNNDSLDNYIVSEDELEGIVIYNVKYIGYPTIWFSSFGK